MGLRSDFSKPCQGAAEKSANATRRCCLVRGSQPVGISTEETFVFAASFCTMRRFFVQKPLADRAGLRTLKSDANRVGSSMGMSSFSTCPFVETRYKKALSLIFALQIRESAFVLLTMRLLSQRIRSTPNSEKRIRQPSLFQHYALIGAQRVGGVGVVTQQFLGIGPAYGQGLGNFPLPQVAENQQLRLAVVPAIG